VRRGGVGRGETKQGETGRGEAWLARWGKGREGRGQREAALNIWSAHKQKNIQLHPYQPQGVGHRFMSMKERQRKKAPSSGTAHTG